MKVINRQFLFEDLYCDSQEGVVVLRATLDSAPVLAIGPAAREISSKSVLCFGMGFSQFANMRRALIESRNTLTAAAQGKLLPHQILAVAAHADGPLKMLDRLEGWANDCARGVRHDIRL